MKRIITALGNPVLNDELRKYSKYDVLCSDIFYQEGLIEFVNTNESDVIVISGLLQGDLSLVQMAEEIKQRDFGTRIIFIVDNISNEERNILTSKGIFDVFYDAEIEVGDVLDAIDREEPINVKAQIEKEAREIKNQLAENSVKYDSSALSGNVETIISAVQKQEVIGFFGTNGSGKSTLCANFTKAFSKKTKANILLIDFDTLHGNLDEVLQVSKVPPNVELMIDEDKKCGLNYAADLSFKNKLDTNVLDEIVIKCEGFDFISGNTSLHYCQNVLNEDFYEFLLKCAKEKYDFIILDLSSNMFLDSTKWALKQCTNVLFVTENTNICLKKSVQILDICFNMWNVYKPKFKLILNRISNNNIDDDIFADVLKLKLAATIKEKQYENDEAYERVLELLDYVPKKGIIKKITQNMKVLTNVFTISK